MAGGTNAVRDRHGSDALRLLEKQLAWLRPFEKAAVGRCPAEVRRRLLEVRPLIGEIAANLRSVTDADTFAGAEAVAAARFTGSCRESCANGHKCLGRRAMLAGPKAFSVKTKISRRNALRYARAFLAKTEKLAGTADWNDLREARMLLLLTAGALENFLYGEMDCFLPRYA